MNHDCTRLKLLDAFLVEWELSAKDVADALGVSPATLYQSRRGGARLPSRCDEAALTLFGVDAAELTMPFIDWLEANGFERYRELIEDIPGEALDLQYRRRVRIDARVARAREARLRHQYKDNQSPLPTFADIM